MKLCFPVNYISITNTFSKEHEAIDLGWKDNPNVAIYSCFNGTVIRSFFDELGGGLTLTIKYDNGYTSAFKHLSKILVQEKQMVSQLEQVAIMGNTGWDTTGPHLHFNLIIDGKKVNPLEYCYVYPNQEVALKDKDKVKYYKEVNMKYKIGDRVVISGDLYVSPNARTASGKINNKTTTITRIAEGTLHPYNTEGDLGWMDESDIKLYQEKNYQDLYEAEAKKNKDLESKLNIANKKIEDAINVLE